MSTLLPNSLCWGILEVVGIEGIKPPCTKEGKTKRQRRKMRGAWRVLLSKDKSVLEMNYFHQLQVTCRVQLAEAICSTCLWLKTPLFLNMDKSQRWMGTKHFRCRIQRCSAGSSEQSQMMCHKPRSAEREEELLGENKRLASPTAHGHENNLNSLFDVAQLLLQMWGNVYLYRSCCMWFKLSS